MWLIVTGFFVHIVFLVSIFDVYFKSPIVHGIVPHSSSLPPPAKRLVLFVADGLRADAFYEKAEVTPYLRSLILERGSWGISHTRVPTETRPGHVALIAGLYEDPSAIARGWKENPVEFDSVFNRSRQTWSWGSPDILPMFAKGASGNHIWMEMYSADLEDFSGKTKTSHLDTWVFDKVKDFLNHAKSNSTLYKKLHENKMVFFLHLLGLDTAGHTYKPFSKEYEENLQVVDKGVEEIEQLFETFYEHDNKTAYIFTSDHGMTNWGSHGAGDASETETPLVAWGAGVSGPQPATKEMPVSPAAWKLENLARKDIKQADIAPLMASLIGIPVPVNSVGFLPRHYLNISDHQLSESVFANARQITAQYCKKRDLTQVGTVSWLYRPFPALDGSREINYIANIRYYINGDKHHQAIALSEELVALSLSGLNYYQTYYQCLLLTCMTLAFLGWIAWLLWILLGLPSSKRSHIDFLYGGAVLNTLFLGLCFATVYLIWVQDLPIQLYVYCLLPEILWWSVARQHSALFSFLRRLKATAGLHRPLFLAILYLMGVEILVVSFFYRFALSIGVLGIALWILLSRRKHTIPKLLLFGWIGSCSLIAIFPTLPVVGREANVELVKLTGLIWVLFGASCILYCNMQLIESRVLYVTLLQMVLLLFAVWNIHSTANSLILKQGLPLHNQLLSWMLFGLSMCLPLLGSRLMLPRLLNVILSLAVPFLLLSASHEGVFLLVLTVHMLCWLALEQHTAHTLYQLGEITFQPLHHEKTAHQTPSSSDFRRAYFFLLYIILSFFGTGNIASINSFDPTWVRCFVTVFSPFLMTVLILWKTMVPFLAVTCTFRALNIMLQAPTEKLFLIVVVLCDMMGLHFLHLVKNEGSWLDIGTSISHFVILQTITLFLVLLYGVARLLTGASLWPLLESIFYRHHPKAKSKTSLEVGGRREVLPIKHTLFNQNTSFKKRHFE